MDLHNRFFYVIWQALIYFLTITINYIKHILIHVITTKFVPI